MLLHADHVVVAPATANILGKAANGIADDFLSTILCAFDRPVLYAPAMNHRMWTNPAVKRNCERLAADEHGHRRGVLGQVRCRLTGRVGAADDEHVLVAIVRRFGDGSPVINAGAAQAERCLLNSAPLPAFRAPCVPAQEAAKTIPPTTPTNHTRPCKTTFTSSPI